MVSLWIFVWTNVLQSSFPAWIIRFGSAISPATESRLKHTTAAFTLIKCRLENMHILPGTDMWHTSSSSGWREWLTNSSDKDVVMFMPLFIFPYSPVSCLFISGWKWVRWGFFFNSSSPDPASSPAASVLPCSSLSLVPHSQLQTHKKANGTDPSHLQNNHAPLIRRADDQWIKAAATDVSVSQAKLYLYSIFVCMKILFTSLHP